MVTVGIRSLFQRKPSYQTQTRTRVILHPAGNQKPREGGSTNNKYSKIIFFAKKRAQILIPQDTAEDLDVDLAMILMVKFWGPNVMKKDKFLEVIATSFRPGNVKALQTPALQVCIWGKLPEQVWGRDKWDRLTQMNLMVVWREFATVINTLGKHELEAPWVPEVIEQMLDIFGLAGFVNQFNFIAHRRDTLRPGLPMEFKRLAGEGFPASPEWLFGDDLGETVEKISKENRLTEKIFPPPKPRTQQQSSNNKKGGFKNPSGPQSGSKKNRKFKNKTQKSSSDYQSPLPQGTEPNLSFSKLCKLTCLNRGKSRGLIDLIQNSLSS